MSESFPHFYCEECGSPIWRRKDRIALWDINDDRRLRSEIDRILRDLPPCHCGGKYSLKGCPRCPKCERPFPVKQAFRERVLSPHVMLVTGAKMLVDNETE